MLSEEGLVICENKGNAPLRSCLSSRDELKQRGHMLRVRQGGLGTLMYSVARHVTSPGVSWTMILSTYVLQLTL